MKDLIKMVVVLTVISAFSGFVLAFVRDTTIDTIKQQILVNEKAPAINSILTGVSNNPLEENFSIKDGKKEIDFFVGKYDGGKTAIAFEASASGFEGAIGVMVGVSLEDDKIIAIGVTTHSETPGIGSRAKTEPFLHSQFKKLAFKDAFKVKADGGQIDAISGATITSQGVCKAVTNASDVYKRFKEDIKNQIK